MKLSSTKSAVQWLKLLPIIIVVFLSFGRVSAQSSGQYSSSQHYNPSDGSNGLPPALEKVSIEQKLNEQIPLEAVFKDENGNEVKLGDLFGKRPVILALVYYECPMLCNEILNGLTGSLKNISFDAGSEFDVIAISFDARENEKPGLAKNKKEGYMGRYERPDTDAGWHFLTGTQSEINKITKSVGFNYYWDEETKQFAHAGGIMVATPEGKLSRYLYGIDYEPTDLKFAIMESAKSKIGSPVDQIRLYCFHYDPSSGKYGLVISKVLQLGGIVTIFGMIVIFLIYAYRRNKQAQQRV